MTTTSPLRLLLAGGPDAPGADAWWSRATNTAAGGRPLRVFLTGAGLAWARDPRLAALARDDRHEIRLCSRSAREHGVRAEDLPSWLGWSSLVAWMRDLDPAAGLWGLFP